MTPPAPTFGNMRRNVVYPRNDCFILVIDFRFLLDKLRPSFGDLGKLTRWPKTLFVPAGSLTISNRSSIWLTLGSSNPGCDLISSSKTRFYLQPLTVVVLAAAKIPGSYNEK